MCKDEEPEKQVYVVLSTTSKTDQIKHQHFKKSAIFNSVW